MTGRVRPPYPLLADPSTQLGDEFDQPARFGAIGQLHDMLGRMPEVLVIDVTGPAPEVVYVHQGISPLIALRSTNCSNGSNSSYTTH